MLQEAASADMATSIRRTMVPVCPIRSSAWIRGPKDRSKPGTRRLGTCPTPCRSNLTCWQTGLRSLRFFSVTGLRCPGVGAGPSGVFRAGPYHPCRRSRGRRARTFDTQRPHGQPRRPLTMNVKVQKFRGGLHRVATSSIKYIVNDDFHSSAYESLSVMTRT